MNRRNFLKSIGAALVVPSVLGRTSTTESIDIPFIIDESTMTATARAACDIRVGDCCMFADEKYNTVIPASSPDKQFIYWGSFRGLPERRGCNNRFFTRGNNEP